MSTDKLQGIRAMLNSLDGNSSMASFAELIEYQLRRMEKVCVFIDNSNLFWALRSMLDNRRLDYIKLRDILSQDRQADVRFYYSEPQNPADEESRQRLIKQRGFYDFLEKSAGYKMVKLPLWERTVVSNVTCDHCGESVRSTPQQVAVEKGLDCEIVYDMCKLSLTSRYDSFILVAGDQDYARTIKKIREDTGIKVDVAFFDGPRVSPVLAKEANAFIDLSDYKEDLFAYRPNEMKAGPSHRRELVNTS
tara:strand:+ start:166 stop:912 length:747 start_codon:yes stop_codon:yes gene_type:complete